MAFGRRIRPLWAWAGRLIGRLLVARGHRRDALANPSAAGMRRLALAGVIANVGIIVTGGLVRVTESGLGCPTWPRCTGDSLLPEVHEGTSAVHTAIEFGNRMMTYAVLAVAVAVYVGALAWRSRRPGYVRLAVIQPLGVVAQALLGGVTVLTGLHPAVVGMHFLLSAVVVGFCVVLWRETVVAARPDAAPAAEVWSAGTGPWARRLAVALVVSTGVVVVAGTVVTGAGPHAGDASAKRWRFLGDRTIEWTTRSHATVAWITVALAVAAAVVVARGGPARPRRSVEWVLILLIGQGVVGYVQYAAGVPAALVVTHMLGAALALVAVVWFAADVLAVPMVRHASPATVRRPSMSSVT